MRSPGSEAGSWLAQAKSAHEASSDGRPDLGVIARQVVVSERVLRERFRARTGHSSHRWYGGIQVRRACDLLKEGTVKDVADQLGNCD